MLYENKVEKVKEYLLSHENSSNSSNCSLCYTIDYGFSNCTSLWKS